MSKPKLKIAFQYWCPEIDAESCALMDALRLKYEVVVTWPADIVFFMCYNPPPFRGLLGHFFKRRGFMKKGFGTPDLWWMKGDHKLVYYTPEKNVPNMSLCDLAFGHAPEEEVEDANYHRMPFYALTYWNDRQELLKPRLERYPWKQWRERQFCEFVYSMPMPEREAFFDILNERERVNAPGRSRNNCAAIGGYATPEEHRQASDCWHGPRLDYAAQHKFAVSHENSDVPGYVTEKIVSAFLAGCIPLYSGSDYAVKDFNPKAFLHMKDFESPEAMAEEAVRLYRDEEACRAILEEPIFRNNELPPYFQKEWILECLEPLLTEK